MKSALLTTFLLVNHVLGQAPCNRADPVIRAIRNNEAGELFCSGLLEQPYIVGTLDETITIPVYITETDTASEEPVFVVASTTTRTEVTSTSFASQQRTANPTKFTLPLPSYVQQYPTPRVSSACSCYIGPANIATYTQYSRCDVLSSTATSYYSITITTGVPNPRDTTTYTFTDTRTDTVETSAPFPTSCPAADGVDYVASDQSAWERICGAYIPSYRPLGAVKAASLDACIEKCVDYNNKEGYSQCQGVLFLPVGQGPGGKNCERYNSAGYPVSGDGPGEVATLRFFEPAATQSDYCATITFTGG